jgi:hypothetical protein
MTSALEVACVGSSITCSTQDGTVQAKSVPPWVERSEGWFGRIPAALVSDLSLSAEALRVYMVLTLKMRGAVASIGMRELGRLVGSSPQTAMRRLAELVEHGAVEAERGVNGQRSRYLLTSPVFSGKPGPVPKWEQAKPSVTCPRCRKPRGGLLRAGHCRSCNLDLKLDRKVTTTVQIELKRVTA